MANGTRSIDYVAKDFDSIVDALIAFATVNFGPDTSANRQWTDFNVDDFSRTWLELLAYVGDLIFFYLDVQATQSNLVTATIRSAVLNIAKQFGFVVPTASSASGLAQFTLTTAQTIPIGFRLAATNGAQFFVSSSSPAPGSTSLQPLLPVLQGEQKTETFSALGVQNEEIVLGFTPLVIDQVNPITSLRTPRVEVNSVAYTQVNSFINSLPTDEHFRLSSDPEGRTIVRFGDGIFGKKLTPNDVIDVDYRIGGGSVGNIAVNTLTSLVDDSTFISSVTNTGAFSGGSDEPTINQLRELIPASLRTLERAVTTNDYGDILIANFNNISKAAAEENTSDPGVDINVYVVPAGNTITPITQNIALFNSIADFLDERKTVTTVVDIKDAFGVDIDAKLEVFLVTGASRAEAIENFTTAFNNFFNLDSGDIDGAGTKFGQKVLLNDIYGILDEIEGVDRFEVKKFTYKPRIVEQIATGSNYLFGEVEVFPEAESSEWLIAPNENAATPNYNTYTVFKKIRGRVSNLSESSLSDDTLNLAVVESVSSAVNTEGTANIVFDSTKTFKVDEWVGGSSNITLSFVSGDTWDFSGASFVPRVGDRIQQGANFAFIKQIVDADTFVLSTGQPDVLVDGAALMLRDEFLFIDASDNVWTIQDNDAHSVSLSQFAINNTVVSDIAAGDYKIVRSLIGSNIIFKNLIFDGIDYNTNNTVIRSGSSFNLVGTINDDFQISTPQLNQGNFGVPVTLNGFQLDTPSPGSGRVSLAGNPDLSQVTGGTSSSYVLIDSNNAIFEIVAVDDINKTVDIIHQSGVTSNPISSGGRPGTLCERYYSDRNEVSFVIGSANRSTGIGFQAIGSLESVHPDLLVDGETFILNDGVNPAVTFEINKVGGVAGGNVEVDLTAAVDADDVRDELINAVGAAATLSISASNSGSAVAAVGSLQVPAKSSLLDGETFTLDDGVNPAVTFEFDTVPDGVTGGNVVVDISADVTADDVKTTIIAAIAGAASLDITASDGGTGIVTLTNDKKGSVGNQAILDTVASAGFIATDLSGGVGGRVFLQNDNVGSAGNITIIEGIADPGFISIGMSGGLNAGSLPTPVIPGPGDSSNDLALNSSGDVMDNFVFRASGFADDIINLRKNEIPQFVSTDLEIDLRGGVS